VRGNPARARQPGSCAATQLERGDRRGGNRQRGYPRRAGASTPSGDGIRPGLSSAINTP
jgi:hypothetical protein